ncbi:outer membrane beta-barrel protein [Ectothiorhodospira haloalkaliphila]|nr:hypothetical protein [Ectothiorhodospira haloalkaliphila]
MPLNGRVVSSKVAASSVFAASLLLAPVCASASNFSYSTLDVAYVYTSFDDDLYMPTYYGWEVHDGVAGVGLGASFQATDNVFLRLGYSYQSSKGSRTEISVRDVGIGVGLVQAVGDRTDVGAVLDLLNTEAEVCFSWDCGKADENGIGFGAFARHWVSQSFEVNANVYRSSYDDFGDETILSLGVAGWWQDQHSIRGTIGVGDDTKIFTLGYQYAFGR